jgi:hypothetical protein
MSMNKNKYKAFYGDKTIIVEATDSYEAVEIAKKQLKAPKKYRHMVHVHLVEMATGEEHVHSTGSVG